MKRYLKKLANVAIGVVAGGVAFVIVDAIVSRAFGSSSTATNTTPGGQA